MKASNLPSLSLPGLKSLILNSRPHSPAMAVLQATYQPELKLESALLPILPARKIACIVKQHAGGPGFESRLSYLN